MLDKFKIGHFTDEKSGTGCTVILSEEGAFAGVSVRGAAPATRETDLLRNEKSIQKLNAVVLSGGSAFGLEAACGVMDYLKEINVGFNAGKYHVPIIAAASLYDLEYKDFAYPNKEAGYTAAKEAKKNNFLKGSIGAGTGATVSKLGGIDASPKSGIGIQTFTLNDLEIAVIVAVNALGDIVKDGEIILGAKSENEEYLDCQRVLSAGSFSLEGRNTTIGCILTNANLTKLQANILADISHDGFALSISPAHTSFDGDAMFVMASGEKNVDINVLSSIIPSLTAKAIQSVAQIGDTHSTQKVNKIMFHFMQKMFKQKK